MARFSDAIYTVLCHEGDKVLDNPATGEYSKYGITLKFLRAEVDRNATKQDIDSLTEARAAALYQVYWWDKYHYGMFNDQTLATKVFDFAVNAGPAPAAKALQSAVNDMLAVQRGLLGYNDGQAPLRVDGLIGIATAHAAALVQAREPDMPVDVLARENLLACFQKHAMKHYWELVREHPRLGENLKGWLSRLADVMVRTASPPAS